MTRGYEPHFDIDREYGEEGEEIVRRFLRLSKDQIEVKRKRCIDDLFYVEHEHDPGARGRYRPSGIAITRADYFVYVIADTGILVCFPTEFLRERLGLALG
jgi:hypothetical protein